MTRRIALPAIIACCAVSVAAAQTVTIEPDAYAESADLTNVSPVVTLSTTLDDNVPVPIFNVTATTDTIGLAPTGVRVFAHANVFFFNNDRRLRLDFSRPIRAISIDFAGGTFFDTEIGRLEAYNALGTRISTYVTSPLGPGNTETMTLVRPQADIEYAMAYIAFGEGDFGRLDNLRITVSCPGDLNGDGVIGESDLGLLLQAWQATAGGDVDGDGDTDESDLGLLLQNWRQACV
ncbi:MAG: hypothetical protein U1D55_08870 [Phycisphaerae bacterium]